MNRFMTLMVMIFFLLLITIVTDSVSMSYGEGFVSDFSGEPGEDKMTVFSVTKTFWKIITFRIEGFPAALNLLVFMPLTFGIIYIVIDVLKDTIPFT
jgi:hypothetical protein